MDMVEPGIDALIDRHLELLRGKRVGLITNPSGVNARLQSTIDVLYANKDIDLRRLFGPEHGVRGRAQAGESISDTVDEKTGVPVSSLYGESCRPAADELADIDVLVYDIQEIGCRFYTYLYTLAYCLEVAGETETRFVVLDRPNPIAPLSPAGNRIPEEHASFIGAYELPVIHGLTVGELAHYFNSEFEMGADLDVVEVADWDRDQWFDETNLPWVPPSPNIPTLKTAILYPGTCFFEGTNLSEGRGTTTPFEYIGAPWIDADEWSEIMNEFPLEGIQFRPVYFTPTFHKHEGAQVEGVHAIITDREAINPLEIGITLLTSALVGYEKSDWRVRDGNYTIDRHAGGPYLREKIDEFGQSKDVADSYGFVKDLQREWADELAAYKEISESYKFD